MQKLAERHLKKPTQRNLQYSNATCRGAVVLLCSHIEGYIEDLCEVVLDRIVSKQSRKNKFPNRFYFQFLKGVILEIKSTEDPDAIISKMIGLYDEHHIHLPLQSTAGVFSDPLPLDAFVKGFSNPTFHKICKMLKNFGYEDYRADLQRTLRAEFLVHTNMIDNIIAQRNKIAHGDPHASSSPADIAEMILSVEKFCQSTDDLTAVWFSKNICAIR